MLMRRWCDNTSRPGGLALMGAPGQSKSQVLNRLERIDEANLEKRIPEYRKIIGLRNIIAHGYDIINDEALWDLVVNKVPKLREMAERY
jgi:uncharacterized protein with HEPN domain